MGTCAGAAGTRAAGTPAARRSGAQSRRGARSARQCRTARGAAGEVAARRSPSGARRHCTRGRARCGACIPGCRRPWRRTRQRHERARRIRQRVLPPLWVRPAVILVAGTALVPGRPRRAARARRPHAVRREQVGERLSHDRRGEQRRVARRVRGAERRQRRHDRSGKQRLDVGVKLIGNACTPPLGRQRGGALASSPRARRPHRRQQLRKKVCEAGRMAKTDRVRELFGARQRLEPLDDGGAARLLEVVEEDGDGRRSFHRGCLRCARPPVHDVFTACRSSSRASRGPEL